MERAAAICISSHFDLKALMRSLTEDDTHKWKPTQRSTLNNDLPVKNNDLSVKNDSFLVSHIDLELPLLESFLSNSTAGCLHY